MKPSRNDPCLCGSGKKYKHCCERKAAARPIFPAAESSQLQLLFNTKKYDAVEAKANTLLEHYPEEPVVWKLLAMALQMQDKQALSAFQKTAQLLPNDAGAQANLGNALQLAGQWDAAAVSFRNALKISPNFAHAHNGLGTVLVEQGHLVEAVASYRRALQFDPNLKAVYSNLGHVLLGLGQYAEGWQAYEYRLEDPELAHIRNASKLQRWRGQTPSVQDRLLVFAEQGFGDTLQFVRFLPLILDKFPGGVSLVVNEPLAELFHSTFPSVEILNLIPSDQRAWQWQCPLLSLPLVFKTTLETIPSNIPYLRPNSSSIAYWQNKIAALNLPANTLKIGVVWQPGTLMKNAKQRSLSIKQISSLLNQPNCKWFSLQKEPDPNASAWIASGKLINWSDEFGDFNETAALASQLNLVISVDTSVVHLAGGLGISTWLFNQHASEWRWMHDRIDSPWYPTMRIFTQKNAGDWDEVVGRMSAELNELINLSSDKFANGNIK